MPFGLSEFCRMPFGLRNAAQTFQYFMDQVLHGLDFCYVYIDDVLVASRTPEEHKLHLRMVLEHFQLYDILINPNKCVLGVAELQFLGHHVNQHRVSHMRTKYMSSESFPNLQPYINYGSSLAW